jgi:hypothetical protein
MTTTLATGAHRITFLQPDLLLLVLGGDVSPGEARELAGFQRQHASGLSHLRYLVDMRQVGELGPESRKVLLESCSSPVPEGGECCVELAVVGARMRAKVLITLQIVALAGQRAVDVRPRYFASRDEALRWAGAERAPEAMESGWPVSAD